MADNTQSPAPLDRAPHIEWVSIEKMNVTDEAQRKMRPDHPVLVHARQGTFNIEAIGYPVVNLRDGTYWIVDGAHRIEALKLIGWGDQMIQCEVYEGLSLAEEAELFLMRDDRRAIGSMEKFKIAVTAGRGEESEINQAVSKLDLKVAFYPGQKGAIHATGTLRKVWRRGGEVTLVTTLSTIRDAFGTAGLTATMIDGLSLVMQRYDSRLDRERLIARLCAVHGGVNGVLNRAHVLNKQTGNQMSHCVAATIVSIYNAGSAGAKLTDWWRPEAA